MTEGAKKAHAARHINIAADLGPDVNPGVEELGSESDKLSDSRMYLIVDIKEPPHIAVLN